MSTSHPRTWFAVDVQVETDAAEAIESAFNQLEANGTEINNLRAERSDTVCVTGYFNELPDDAETRGVMAESLAISGFEIGRASCRERV